MEIMKSHGTCCFCGDTLDYMNSHNPYPACTVNDARCCAECNARIVIPARIITARLIAYEQQKAR